MHNIGKSLFILLVAVSLGLGLVSLLDQLKVVDDDSWALAIALLLVTIPIPIVLFFAIIETNEEVEDSTEEELDNYPYL